jgi:hypothetical protein
MYQGMCYTPIVITPDLGVGSKAKEDIDFELPNMPGLGRHSETEAAQDGLLLTQRY